MWRTIRRRPGPPGDRRPDGAGQGGGWFVDRDHALPSIPSINLTAEEALAVAAALAGAEDGTPFSAAGPAAMRKLAERVRRAETLRSLSGA